MEPADVQTKIKEIIANVTSIPATEIGDRAHYVDELGLDSLSLLEIGVDVDYEFKLGLPEEAWQDVTSVDEAAALVLRHLDAKTAVAA